MEYRRMEEKDVEQVVTIEEKTFSMPWTREAFLESMNNPSHVYVVAAEGTTVFGYCGMWGIAGEGQINNVAVREDARGKGTGFAIMEFALSEGKKQGLEAFTLEVRESNAAAIHVYEKAGFKNVGIRKDFYDMPKENAVIMWKN